MIPGKNHWVAVRIASVVECGIPGEDYWIQPIPATLEWMDAQAG